MVVILPQVLHSGIPRPSGELCSRTGEVGFYTGWVVVSAIKAAAMEFLAFTAPRSTWGTSARLGIIPSARHAENHFAGSNTTFPFNNLRWFEEARLHSQDEVVPLKELGRAPSLFISSTTRDLLTLAFDACQAACATPPGHPAPAMEHQSS
jgi:hypothetical protein